MTTDYDFLGDENTIAMSYKKLAHDVKKGSQILCADGSIVLVRGREALEKTESAVMVGDCTLHSA